MAANATENFSTLHHKNVIKSLDITRKQVVRLTAGSTPVREKDELAAEEPLEIQVDTRSICVTMRTPGHDAELAAGFLLTEGLITDRKQIRKIQQHPRNEFGNLLNVFLAPDVAVDFGQLTRHVFASSSCGLCGKTSIQALHRRFKPVNSKWSVRAKVLLDLPGQLRQGQEGFARTGGLHAAAVFTRQGQLVILREDIGRHNAVDKVLGYGLLKGLLPFDRHILMVSGRASFEIVQKALAAQVAVVAAVSAPSSLAVQLARESRQTLAGFIRDRRMNIYAGAERIR
jgi:FdhD protein